MHQEIRVRLDDGEQIVEVVRDPAGEPADRLELLAVAQLLLDVPALSELTVGSLQQACVLIGQDGAARNLASEYGCGDRDDENEERRRDDDLVEAIGRQDVQIMAEIVARRGET